MNEAPKSYRELRHEAEYLSQLLFGDRFTPQHHCEAIEAALANSLAWRGRKAFDPPIWHVWTSDFQSYYVSEKPDGRFRVRLDEFASFREVEHWKYAIGREEEKRGIALSSADAFAAAGFLPWTDTAVIAIALLKQAIRSGAPKA
jgi:hypothetical protein